MKQISTDEIYGTATFRFLAQNAKDRIAFDMVVALYKAGLLSEAELIFKEHIKHA